MNRRNFFRSLVGGVAVAAAVRTWPFRVYSFPTELKRFPVDLGYNVFDYAGLPVIIDNRVPNDRIYAINNKLVLAHELYARYQLSIGGQR